MFIYIEDFYQDVSNIFGPINTLNFMPFNQGLEIQNFHFVPEGIANAFSNILGRKIKLDSNSGLFRKPYVPVHFENYNPKTFFVGAVAFEKVRFCTYKHKITGSIHVESIAENVSDFIRDNCFEKNNWDIVADILMSPGSLILFKPWVWHSFEQKLLSFFYLEEDKCENVVPVKLAVKDGSLERPTE